jgi:hypothetical protein
MIADEAATHPKELLSPTLRSLLCTLAAVSAFGRFLFGSPSLAEADPGAGARYTVGNLHSAKAAGDGDDSIRPSTSASFPMRSTPLQRVGQRRRIPNSRITTGFPKAVTLRRTAASPH